MLPANITTRYFNWNFPMGRDAVQPGDANARVNFLLPSGQSVPGVPAVVNLATFDLPPAPGPLIARGIWTFDWLEYVAGETTFRNFTNDTMTGPMSGCAVATFIRNGAARVMHIGTGTATQTTTAKQLWNQAVTAPAPNQITIVRACNPAAKFSRDEQNAVMLPPHNSVPIVCAYFVPGGATYALLLAKVPPAGSPLPNTANTMRVMAVKQVMDLREWAAFAGSRDYTHADFLDPDLSGKLQL